MKLVNMWVNELCLMKIMPNIWIKNKIKQNKKNIEINLKPLIYKTKNIYS